MHVNVLTFFWGKKIIANACNRQIQSLDCNFSKNCSKVCRIGFILSSLLRDDFIFDWVYPICDEIIFNWVYGPVHMIPLTGTSRLPRRIFPCVHMEYFVPLAEMKLHDCSSIISVCKTSTFQSSNKNT
jgi:hypothetical protein